MEAEYIRTEPFEFKQIITASFDKGINEHGSGCICGYIRKEEGDTYTAYPIGSTPVVVYAVGEDGEERIIFYGVLSDLKIIRENAQLYMELRIVAYTRLMDLTRRTRSFQNSTMTYQDVLNFVCAMYEGAAFIMAPEIAKTPIGNLLVQYQETDWEFILRLASHFQTVVVADYLTEGEKFYFGLPDREALEVIDAMDYHLQKSMMMYHYKVENEVAGTSEYDDMSIITASRKLYETGDQVLFEGRPYVVSHVSSGLDGHQLAHTYVLTTAGGMKVPKQYVDRITGASLDGWVTGVRQDVVQVKLGIEDPWASCRWFPFATVFSSPDGSGWYCMPQVGDEIRLYFPTRSEKHAYVISSVHLPAGGGTRTVTTSNELRSPDGKLIQLNEDSIILDNGKGLTITMMDGEGISISSTGSVSINAGGTLDISSGGEVTIAAAGMLALQGGGSAGITMEPGGVVTVNGAKVKLQ